MNVGIDVTSLLHGRGVSRYTANLIRALLPKKELSIQAFGYSLRRKEYLETIVHQLGITHAEIIAYPQSMMNLLWKLGLHPVSKFLPNIDVFHSWDWLQPPDKHLPLVSTIHDIAILKFPETAHPSVLRHHQHSWKVLQQRQAEIIAVSRSTKKDIVELLGIPAYKVHVIHEALPLEFRQSSDRVTDEQAEQIKQKLQLTRPYILFVGTREPRKNIVRIIEAWQPLAKQYELVIVGEKGWDDTEKMRQPSLRFLGRVSDTELAVLYGEAELFCYPSLYEGFGLPILEAFYHGTPVVTSETSSMPEVAGNAAELVNPESVESIRQGMVKILNESLSEQQKRLQRMVIRLHMFQWDQVARETIGVYRQAIQQYAS